MSTPIEMEQRCARITAERDELLKVAQAVRERLADVNRPGSREWAADPEGVALWERLDRAIAVARGGK